MRVRPIHTEKDYRDALSRIEELFDAKRGAEKGEELEVLGILVEDYEKKYFPVPDPKPLEAIKFRMEQLGLSQKDLSEILGSRSRASEILSGKRSLSLRQIKVISKKLDIPADVLIEKSEPVIYKD